MPGVRGAEPMARVKRWLIFAAGCLLSAVLALGCWGVLDWVLAGTHPYITVVMVNMVGYVGHGITSYLARRYIKKP